MITKSITLDILENFEKKSITLDILENFEKIDYTRYSGFRGENRATDLLCDLRPKKPSDSYPQKSSEKFPICVICDLKNDFSENPR